MDHSLRQSVLSASTRPEVREAVESLYAELQSHIDARRPLCSLSGRCCRFEEFGHRLYLTTMELATFVHHYPPAEPYSRGQGSGRAAPREGEAAAEPLFEPGNRLGGSLALPKAPAERRESELQRAVQNWTGLGCPFQVGKRCGVHQIRPFGCRIFFCDPTAAEWQADLYEQFHARLKRLHESLAVPYHYVEWRQALRAVLL